MSAKRTLTRFIKYWKQKNPGLMRKHTQLTWQNSHPTNNQLQWLVNDYPFKSFEIVEEKRLTSVHREFIVKLDYDKFKVNVLCESGPFKPSIKGRWGVNPISVKALSK